MVVVEVVEGSYFINERAWNQRNQNAVIRHHNHVPVDHPVIMAVCKELNTKRGCSQNYARNRINLFYMQHFNSLVELLEYLQNTGCDSLGELLL